VETRFSTTWNGGPASIRRWLKRFGCYCDTQRLHRALDGRMPAKEA
jgi:hypothetical protein